MAMTTNLMRHAPALPMLVGKVTPPPPGSLNPWGSRRLPVHVPPKGLELVLTYYHAGRFK